MRRSSAVLAFVSMLVVARAAGAEEAAEDDAETRRPLFAIANAGVTASVAEAGDPVFLTRGAFGARLSRWTIGASFTYYRGSVAASNEGPSVPVWGYILGPEVAVHFPIGRFEPFVGIEGGYFHTSETVGGAFGLLAGADVFVSSAVSLGLVVEGENLYSSKNAERNSGLVSASLRVGFHFDPR